MHSLFERSSAAPSRPPLVISVLKPTNSVDFLRAVFRLYGERQLFAICKDESVASLSEAVHVVYSETSSDISGWFDEAHDPIFSPKTAQITFTSGTTGLPKGILLSHENLADTVERLVGFQELNSNVREYVGVPAHYSFGLARFRACAAVGGRAFIPARGFDPFEIGRMLRDRQINSLAAVPSLLRLLINQPSTIGKAGRFMRWIEIGSQHMTRPEKERLKEIFPEAHMTQHYGMTEAARSTLLDVSTTEGTLLESSGKPVAGTEINLSCDGRIMVRGRHVARQWIDRSGLHSLVDAQGWLTSNDDGEIDSDGNLFFRGRADDIINFGGVKLVPDLIEDRIRAQLAQPVRFAVARMPHRERGEGILLATDEPTANLEALRATALDVLSGFGVSAGGGLEILRMELPTTDTGKVRRKLMTEAVSAQHASRIDIQSTPDEEPSEKDAVLSAFRAAFPTRRVALSDTFVDLGGDSLAHVSIAVQLDASHGLPRGWEQRSVADLQTHYQAAEVKPVKLLKMTSVSPELVLRSLAVLMIVVHHASSLDLGGGIDVLLLLVGVNLARFQTDRLLSTSRWRLLLDIFVRLVLPYYVVVAIVNFRHPADYNSLDYALLSNFSANTNVLAPYWFVCGYFQSIMLLLVACCFSPVAALLRSNPGLFGAAMLGLALVVKVVALGTFHHAGLLGRTPDQFIHLIALGWCAQKAQGPLARGLVAGLALGIAILSTTGICPLWAGFDGQWHGIAVFLAIIVLLYVPRILVPNIVRHAITEVAVASLVIYLVHSPILAHLHDRSSPTEQILAAILVSIILSRFARWASHHISFLHIMRQPELSAFGRSR